MTDRREIREDVDKVIYNCMPVSADGHNCCPSSWLRMCSVCGVEPRVGLRIVHKDSSNFVVAAETHEGVRVATYPIKFIVGKIHKLLLKSLISCRGGSRSWQGEGHKQAKL